MRARALKRAGERQGVGSGKTRGRPVHRVCAAPMPRSLWGPHVGRGRCSAPAQPGHPGRPRICSLRCHSGCLEAGLDLSRGSAPALQLGPDHAPRPCTARSRRDCVPGVEGPTPTQCWPPRWHPHPLPRISRRRRVRSVWSVPQPAVPAGAGWEEGEARGGKKLQTVLVRVFSTEPAPWPR